MIHYKSGYKMWTTACGIVSSSTPTKTTRNKKKVTCKKCKRTIEFKQKTKWEKIFDKIGWK